MRVQWDVLLYRAPHWWQDDGRRDEGNKDVSGLRTRAEGEYKCCEVRVIDVGRRS